MNFPCASYTKCNIVFIPILLKKISVFFFYHCVSSCLAISTGFYFNDEMYYLLERGVGLGTNMCASGGNVRIEK